MSSLGRTLRAIGPGPAVGALLVGIFLAAAIFGPSLAPYGPEAQNLDHLLEPPTRAHWFGTDDKVKPVLVKRPMGKSDPAAAHKGVREAYIGGRWHKANLYEMDLLQPGHEVTGPAIVEHPATTLVVHPQDRVTIDEWTLLHYSHA